MSNKIKVELSKVAVELKNNNISDDVINSILGNLLEPPSEEELKEPATKKEHVVLISTSVELPLDTLVWVIKKEEDIHPSDVEGLLHTARNSFAMTRKGRKLNVKQNISETLELVPAKYFAEHGILVSTKTPSMHLVVDNTTIQEGNPNE